MTPRIAIACSGLGHVLRGNETWARNVADALAEVGTLVSLFGGGAEVDASARYVQLPTLRRESPLLNRWMSWDRRYLLEQVSFEFSLRRHLLRDPHQVVHAADPALALRLHQREGRVGVRVLYKDGLLIGPEWCRKFDFVQVLAPHYREEAHARGVDVANWFVIPHLVDSDWFAPPADRAAVRAKWFGDRIGQDDLVVLAVGDFAPRSQKRLDWVVREVARVRAGRAPHLLVLGHASPDDERRFHLSAEQVLPGRVHVLSNMRPAQMREMYQLADVFAHAALREPFGIVFLEAMASGLPVVGHTFPVTRWIIGDGGRTVDMKAEGELAAVLTEWASDPAKRREIGGGARARAINAFSRGRIVPLYQEAYGRMVVA